MICLKSRLWNRIYENLKYENGRTANLRTKIMDFRGSDSSIILISRGGILMSTGDFAVILSQRILSGRFLVGRLGVPIVLL